jgi:hypothetical protein
MTNMANGYLSVWVWFLGSHQVPVVIIGRVVKSAIPGQVNTANNEMRNQCCPSKDVEYKHAPVLLYIFCASDTLEF